MCAAVSGAQNLRLNPGPTADAPWLLVVRWKPVSLRSSSPCRDDGNKVNFGFTSFILIIKLTNTTLVTFGDTIDILTVFITGMHEHPY